MNLVDIAGYLAAVLMFSTFYMKKMIPLRAAGASANLVFVIYTLSSYFVLGKGIWPLFVLHAALFPLNITRMVQMIRLVNKVRESSKGNFAIDFLTPYMSREHLQKGDCLFRKGDESLKLYYVQHGVLRIEGIEVTLGEGDLIGELGIFSSDNQRSATVVCETDVDLLAITKKNVMQLYYQNPTFGFYLVQLVTDRFLKKENRELMESGLNAR